MIQSVFDLFLETSSQLGNQVAARHKQQGCWQNITWNELEKQVKQVACALLAVGAEPRDRVAILSNTRLEWVVSDLAILASGCTTVPIYPSNLSKDVAYIINDATVRIIFVEDKNQLAKVEEHLKDMPFIRAIICLEDVPTPSDNRIISFSQFLQWGKKKELQKEVKARYKQLLPSDLASIVYTSGTTGFPKGAMIMHSNLMYEGHAIEKLGILSAEDVQLLFLPLAHIFAKVLMIAWLKTGHVLVFAESIEKVVDNMVETKPTLMAAVPRIYEKVQSKVVSTALSDGGLKATLATWAFALSEQASKAESEGRSFNSIPWLLAQRLVLRKIGKRLKERFGGRMRILISGGAPLAKEVAYFFKHCGIIICEGYGLTETSAATCLNLPQNVKLGSVGRPVPGTEVRIATDGEILVRGPGVFQGYWNLPEATKEVLSADGWFHTGDIGVLDKNKFLYITDRKKDLIVTAGGKNIAPQKLENLLKSKSPLISQVIAHGDKRRFICAIVTLDEASLKDFAHRNKVKGSYKEMAAHPLVHQAIEESLRSMNADLPSFEQIKKFHILDHDLTVGEELTPTLKVKRAFCNQKFKAIFDSLYE